MQKMMSTRLEKQGGFTLIEAMIAMVVLGIAAAAVLIPFTTGASVQAEGMHRTLSAKLASELMERIVNCPFEDIINNYNGYSEATGQVTDSQEIVIDDSSYAEFSRDVTCEYVYVTPQSGVAAANFISVNVRVYYDGDEMASVRRLISE